MRKRRELWTLSSKIPERWCLGWVLSTQPLNNTVRQEFRSRPPRKPLFQRKTCVGLRLLVGLILWICVAFVTVRASDGDAKNRATIEAENAQARYYRHELNFWRHPIVPALATLVTALVAATVALRTHYQNKIEARLFETIKILGDSKHAMRSAAIELLRGIASKHPSNLRLAIGALTSGLIVEREPEMRAMIMWALRDLGERYGRGLLSHLIQINLMYRNLLQETVAQYFVVSGAYGNPGDSDSTKFRDALSAVSRITQLDEEAIWWLFCEQLDNDCFRGFIQQQLGYSGSGAGKEENLEPVTERLRRCASSLQLSCELISAQTLRGLPLRDLPIVRQIIRLVYIILRPGQGEPLGAPKLWRNYLMNCYLPHASLQRWQVENCVFYKTDFSSAYFSRARFKEVNFVDCKLRHAHFGPSLGHWGPACLEDVYFTRTMVYKATFSDAKTNTSARVPEYYVTHDEAFTSPPSPKPWTYRDAHRTVKPI
jgi:Pentapeptide repeats (8 copies)